MLAKRIFDAVVALLGLVLTAPLLVAIAISIKATSAGPVFYRGVRIGLLGRPFRIFKFRSMVADAERRGGSSTASDDARITGVGKFLRRHKLDEAPQLLNVLAGDMSLVGPRPEVEQYTSMYTDEEKAILTVRPGITDWASLWNPDEGAVLAGSEDPERDYLEKIRPGKIRFQLKYVRERDFWVDLKILAATAWTVVSRSPSPLLEETAAASRDASSDQEKSEPASGSASDDEGNNEREGSESDAERHFDAA